MIKTDLIDILLNNKLFDGADRDNVNALVCDDKCYMQEYANGQSVDIQNRIAFVVKGCVCVYSIDSKRHLLLRKVEKNEFFGLAGLFVPDMQISCCVSKGNSEVVLIEKRAVEKILETDKAVMRNYIALLSKKISYLNKKITYLTAGSAERKLAVYLLSQKSENIEIKVSYSALSDMLDIGRASLYRAFDRFVSDGCIKRDGNTITVINKALMLEKY